MNFEYEFDYEDMLSDLLFGGGYKESERRNNSLMSLGKNLSDMENTVFDVKTSLEMLKRMVYEMNDDVQSQNKNNVINNDIRELNLSNRHDVIKVISKVIKEKDFEVANLLKGKFEYFGYEPVSLHSMKFGIGDEDAIEQSFQEVCSGFMSLDLNNNEDCTKLLNFIAFLPF